MSEKPVIRPDPIDLQHVFDAVSVGLMLVNERGEIQLINDALVKWAGKELASASHAAPGDFMGCIHAVSQPGGCGHAEHCAVCPIRRALMEVLNTGKAVHAVETESTMSLNGREVDLWLEINADPVLRDGKRHVILALNNITARKQDQEALHRAAAILKRSNLDLEQFAYAASHDLREPLRAVAGFADLLQRHYQDKLDDKAARYISEIVGGAGRMQTLIDDLLTYSRVSVRDDLAEHANAQDSFNAAVANLQASVAEARAKITSDPLPTLRVGRSQLTMLFQNLIGNAVKFRSQRPLEVHVGARHEDGNWLFWVRDNGIGIDSRHAERIFVIFQRLHTREQYPGTGIGLAVCKKIVERHGGRIWVESQPDQGAAFFFTIPDKPTAL